MVMQVVLSIAQARKKHRMTQEEVARHLGVSHVAVSKWERGISYPDITLLPAIARLFHMSLDELFAYQEKLSKEEANEIARQVLENFQTQSIDEAITSCKEKIKQYPADLELMLAIGTHIWYAVIYAKSEEEMMTVLRYAQELLLKVKNSENTYMRELACAGLSNLYLMQENTEEALQVLDEIEEQHIDVHQLKAGIYVNQKRYEEAQEVYAALVLKNIVNIRMCMMGIGSIAMIKKDTSTVMKTTRQIESLLRLFEIEMPLANEYLQCTRACIEEENTEDAKAYLLKCLTSLGDEVVYPEFFIGKKQKQESIQSVEEVRKNFLRAILEEPCFQAYINDEQIQKAIHKIQHRENQNETKE